MNAQSISLRVAQTLLNASAGITDTVVNKLAQREVERRADALLGAVELAGTTANELTKALKPDIHPTTFDAAGKAIGTPGYSKGQLATQKKLKERAAKIDKAIEKATRERVAATADVAAVGVEGEDGYVPAVKGTPAVEPDFGDLYNLKSLIDQAEKESAKTDGAE